jgi:hypothetical protein
MRNAMTSLYMTPIDYGGPAMMDFSPFAMPDAGPFAGATAGASPGASAGAPRMMIAPPSAPMSTYQEPMGFGATSGLSFGSYDQMMGRGRPRNFMAGGGYRPPPVAPYSRPAGGFGQNNGFGGYGSRGYSTYSPMPGSYGGLNPYGQMF